MVRPDYKAFQVLSHSAKGTTWGKHKYIRKENGRYIYPADLEKEKQVASRSSQNWKNSQNQAASVIRNNRSSVVNNMVGAAAKANQIDATIKKGKSYTKNGVNSNIISENSSVIKNKKRTANANRTSARLNIAQKQNRLNKTLNELTKKDSLASKKKTTYEEQKKKSEKEKQQAKDAADNYASYQSTSKETRRKNLKKKGQDYMKKTLKKRVGR